MVYVPPVSRSQHYDWAADSDVAEATFLVCNFEWLLGEQFATMCQLASCANPRSGKLGAATLVAAFVSPSTASLLVGRLWQRVCLLVPGR